MVAICHHFPGGPLFSTPAVPIANATSGDGTKGRVHDVEVVGSVTIDVPGGAVNVLLPLNGFVTMILVLQRPP
jgi:hypothetical protein